VATRVGSTTERLNTNIWIPHELLQSANSDFYAFSRRRTVNDERETRTLSHILEQPAQAILATNPPRRARTLDHAPNGRLHTGLSRVSPTASQSEQRRWSHHAQSNANRQRVRASSIGSIALTQREQQLARAESPLLIEYDRPTFHFQTTVGPVAYPPRARVSPTTPTADVVRTSSGQTPGPRHGSASPTHQVGRVSIQRGEQIPYDQLRHSSFVPGPDTISIRRPTYEEPTSQSILRKASVAVGNVVSKVVPKTRQSSIAGTYERAKIRQKQLQRSKPAQILFQYLMYSLLLAFVYFVMVGQPLWGGVVW